MTRAWKLTLVIVVLMLAGAAGSFVAPTATAAEGGAGVWAQVCCGSGCSPSDYCIGDGTYTCCKGVEAELQ